MKTIELTDEEAALIKELVTTTKDLCISKQKYYHPENESQDEINRVLRLSKSILEKL